MFDVYNQYVIYLVILSSNIMLLFIDLLFLKIVLIVFRSNKTYYIHRSYDKLDSLSLLVTSVLRPASSLTV